MNLIEAKHISKAYGVIRKTVALNGVDFYIGPGECKAIVGPNGAGKTTFLKIIAGVTTAFKGTLEGGATVGYCSEVPSNYPYLTAAENLVFFKSIVGSTVDVTEVLKIVNLENERKLASQFSKGMKRKLEIARALILDADLLIMDEPFDGLDPITSKDISDVLNKLKIGNKGIIISSHDMHRIQEVADEICFISKGVIFRRQKINALLRLKVNYSGPVLSKSDLSFISEPSFDISGNTLFFSMETENDSSEIISRLVERKIRILTASIEPLDEQFRRIFNESG